MAIGEIVAIRAGSQASGIWGEKDFWRRARKAVGSIISFASFAGRIAIPAAIIWSLQEVPLRAGIIASRVEKPIISNATNASIFSGGCTITASGIAAKAGSKCKEIPRETFSAFGLATINAFFAGGVAVIIGSVQEVGPRLALIIASAIVRDIGIKASTTLILVSTRASFTAFIASNA